jgi:hypothetical protein
LVAHNTAQGGLADARNEPGNDEVKRRCEASAADEGLRAALADRPLGSSTEDAPVGATFALIPSEVKVHA